ncbi:MAG: FAD-dependent thymidylate synthase [Armatimonadota bacterium]
MRVELISHTEDPERTVAAAVRLCYSASDIATIRERIGEDEAAKLIGKVLKLGHLSVLEHASFTFAIEGISRACSHQLVRHRMASFSQQSQRYVTMQKCGFAVPPTVRENDEYHRIMETLQAGYDALLASGVPAEDARYLLPNAAETKIIMTANARSLLNFFELRLCTRAQWEIRRLAELMLAEVKPVAPNIFASAGPTCETSGYCREGEMTCGRLKE